MEAQGLQRHGLDWCLTARTGVGSLAQPAAGAGATCLAASCCLWFMDRPGWPPHSLSVLRADSPEHSSWGSFRGERGCSFHI